MDYRKNKTWMFGRVSSVEEKYTKLTYEIETSVNEFESMNVEIRKLQPFRSSVVPELMLFPVKHRTVRLDEENEQIEDFALPFLITVSSDLTWKEIHLIIFL